MEKKFNIEQLGKGNPFKTPEGYFEGLASRVMSQIPDVSAVASSSAPAERKTKVVGLMPRKKNRKWLKWGAAIAACVCGVALFLTNQSKEDPATQLADTSSTKKIEVTETAPETTTDVQQAVAPKQYANAAFDLSQRHKRSSATAEPSRNYQYTAYTPVKRESVAATPSNVATTKEVKTSPSVKPSTAPSSTTNMASTVSNTGTQSTTLASNIENMDDYDLLDYTQMSGSEIYDFLAGNDYY